MKFDINDYDQNTVMHCPTQEASDTFMQYLHNAGERWCSGQSYLSSNHFPDYCENTCYAFNQGKYCGLGWYIEHGFQILEFDDFTWGDEIECKPELCISFADVLLGYTEE